MDAQTTVVRPWRRGDQRRIQHWPRPEVPAHWITPAERPGSGQRENWAIEDQGRLVGRILLYDLNRHALHQPSARMGIYLRPGYYGRGIGSAALTQFFTICPVIYLRLDVASDNQRAIRCYRRAGFADLCFIWGEGPVAYIEMERHIAPNRAVCVDAVHSTAH